MARDAVDRRGPLQGATAATTALLQYEIDLPLTALQQKIGPVNAARAWRRSKLGLESLAAKVQSLGIRCAYKRVSSLYLAGPLLDAAGLAQECQATQRHRPAHGVPDASGLAGALRHQARGGPAVL